jgi:signal transduction histidine kinase
MEPFIPQSGPPFLFRMPSDQNFFRKLQVRQGGLTIFTKSHFHSPCCRLITTFVCPLYVNRTFHDRILNLPLTSFFTALVFIYALTSHAQAPALNSVPGYNIRHFNDENGLHQNIVKGIVQDERGNIWLAMERGLVRYDGRKFVEFTAFGNTYASRNIAGFHLHPKNRKPGLLAMTQPGNWLRVVEGNAKIDSTLKGPAAYAPGPQNPYLNEVFDVLPLPTEASYREKISEIIPKFPSPNGRNFAYNKGIVEYYVNNEVIKRVPFANKDFFHFFQLGGDLYYLDQRLKLFRFGSNSNIGHPEQLDLQGDIIAHLSEKRLDKYQIFWVNVSNQVFIQLGQKLFFLQRQKSGVLHSKLLIENFDFNSAEINTIYFDQKNEHVYLGSKLNGLYIVDKKPFRTLTLPGAADNIYYGQTLSDSNGILTTEGHQFRIDGPEGTPHTQKLDLIGKSTNWDQYSILKDRNGRIWSKQGDQLFLFDREGARLKSKWRMKSWVSQLYQGPNGRIWVGTAWHGLYYIDPGQPDNTPVHYPIKPIIDISWMQHRSPNELWIGSGEGLYKLDLSSKKVFKIKGLEKIYIRSLYIPEVTGEVWITTYTNGFFLLKDGKLTKFPLDRHGYLANAHCVLEDKNGFLWITTNRGLFQVKKSDLLAYAKSPFELYYHYYPKSAGFNTNEFNGGCQPCAVRMANGVVSLPSINGLVWFTPEKITTEQPKEPIFIDNLQIDGKTSATNQKEMRIPANASEISLTISTPYFGEADNLHLSYTIFKGKRSLSGWKVLDENMRISIPFLQGGTYTLSIRKLNGFGPRNYAYRNVVIVVEKEWFETWWFYITLILLVSVTIFLTVRVRLKRVEKRNQMLESQISNRTEQLRGTMKTLEESQSELLRQMHLQSRLMASIGHDVRTPLRAAIIVAREMRNLIERQQLKEALEYGTNIEDAMVRVKDSLESLLAYVKIQVFKREVHTDKINLHSLVQKNFHLYGEAALSEPNKFVNQVPGHVIVQTSHQLLDVIIHNLVDNANKFTNNGTIKASVAVKNGRLLLTIEDTGRGIPGKLLDWMNGPSLTAPAEYNGVGLMIIKELLPYVAERIEMQNLNPGTATVLYFPDFWLSEEPYQVKSPVDA